MTTMFRNQWTKLRDKFYRESFVEAEVKRGIPFQMRALLKSRGLSQQQLAERSGLTQGAISRALNPNYGNLTLNTIIRIAAGFDIAFVGTFVSFSRLLRAHEDLDEDRVGSVPDFVAEEKAAVRVELLEDQVGAFKMLRASSTNAGYDTALDSDSTEQPLALAGAR